MKKAVLIALALFGFAGAVHAAEMTNFAADTGIENVADSRLAGAWKSVRPVHQERGLVVYLGLRFNAEDADMSAICQFPGRKVLEAAVNVPVRVADGKITVLSGSAAEVKDGNYRCAVEMQAGTVDYTFVGKNLRLTSQGQNMDFARRK